MVPFEGAALSVGAETEQQPAMWLYHAVLFLQFYLLAFALGWIAGRYRSRAVTV
ncbi:hypothetical protein GCM10007067_05760 [Lysobacter bugurensis]|uniref:Uncharacterized protein n=1 Tax=Cognatilysobacter bugurensis TaxID=543356 RepID=A0A918W6U9_9GAMM|nr:hypothetical protein GCM10007067_05760 [Lysobacter bugurensis]